MAPLDGTHVVVIGGSSGIGLAGAHRLRQAGAAVTLVGRSSQRLAAAAATFDSGVGIRAADLGDATSAPSVFDDLGPVDHLVVAAGGSPAWGPFADLDPAALRRAFDAKFFVHFNAARFALPHLRHDGSITFVTGGAARSAIPGTAGLAAVNGAIQAMARTLAKEQAPIRVNVLAPGFVDTPAYDGMADEAKRVLYARMERDSLVGRVGSAEEQAEALLLLVANRFVTGAVVDVDGGRRLV